MSAVLMRSLVALRARRGAWLLLAVLAGTACGITLALVAGARRSESAIDRYQAAENGGDAYVVGFDFEHPHLRLAAIRALPGVISAQRSGHLFVISRSSAGEPLYPLGAAAVQYAVPLDGRSADFIDRARIVSGRPADPRRPDEAVADVNALRSLRLHVGDRLVLGLARNGRDPGGFADDPLTSHAGPLAHVRIVGVQASNQLADGGGLVHLTPAFLGAHGGASLMMLTREVAVRLRRGAADLPAFRRAVGQAAGRSPYHLFEPSEWLPKVRRALRLQAGALRLLALFAAAGALLLIGQALAREAAIEARSHESLRTLGMTRWQLTAVGAVRACVIAVAAAAVAVLLAYLLSSLAPLGLGRDLEPRPGLHFDTPVLAGGGVIVLAAVVLLGTATAARAASRAGSREAHAPHRRGSPAGLLSRGGAPPSLVAGARMTRMRGTIATAAIAVTIVVVALVFASSLARLLDTPRLYGQTWDFESLGGGDDAALVRSIVGMPGLAAVARGSDTRVSIAGRDVGAMAMDDLKGAIRPAVLQGRAPRGPGEVLLGARTFDDVGAHLGRPVVVRSGAHAEHLRVVGRGVLPAGKINTTGEGAFMSFRALRRIAPADPGSILDIRIAPTADRRATMLKLAAALNPSVAVRPAEIGNFGGVSGMPALLAALFGAVALAALGHALATSTRRRRRPLATLKALGFTSGQVGAIVAWQATIVSALGLLAGIPLGVLGGRFVWGLFADALGVVPLVVTPVALVAGLVPAALLLANLVAIVPAMRAARIRPAVALRAE